MIIYDPKAVDVKSDTKDTEFVALIVSLSVVSLILCFTIAFLCWKVPKLFLILLLI
jgi:hypothetical protein